MRRPQRPHGQSDGFGRLRLVANQVGLKPWDVAAGGLLVSEAGGRVSDFRGQADFLEARECIAGNPALCVELGAILRPFALHREPPSAHAS